MKNLFKKAMKKNVPKPRVPEVKRVRAWGNASRRRRTGG
jgi:hypothetical protein